MKILYRQALPDDVPQCADLFLEAVKDLRLRHNLPASESPSAADMIPFYQHVLATGIFQVAEADGKIAALACAVVRDQLWFLSGFWARPDLQRQGVGMPMLRSVWLAGRQAEATHFFVWASIDLPAVAAYMKIGMLPGCQIFTFEGMPERLNPPLADRTIEPLDPDFAMDLDQIVRGTRRPLDHAFFAATGSRGRQLVHNGQRLGYYYLEGSFIGPAAWTEPEHAPALLAAACREASASGSIVTLPVPGMNHAALRFALEAGLRLQGSSNLLMSAPFGRLEQYIPSGPGLF